MTIIDKAHELLAAGLKPIAVKADKAPTTKTLKQFDGKIPYDKEIQIEDINAMFDKESAIAMLCGNGVECIDIDSKNYTGEGDLFKMYVAEIESYPHGKSILEKCYLQRTPSGGYHIIYLLDNAFISNNKRLAVEEFEKADESIGRRVLIETRGNHGYCLVYPSPGYQIEKGDLSLLSSISVEERNVLFTAAIVFNKTLEIKQQVKAYKSSEFDSEKIWNRYNAETDIVSYLCQKGWTKAGEDPKRVYLKRPADGIPTTAVNSGNYHKQYNLFIAHTTSTPLTPEQPYTAFDLLVTLEYRNNFKDALKHLKEIYKVESIMTFKAPIIKEDLTVKPSKRFDGIELFGAKVFDWDEEVEELNPTLFVHHSKCSRRFSVGLENSIGAFTGAAKSRKTAMALEVIKAALTGLNYGGFEMEMPRDKIALIIDTEQPVRFFKHRISKLRNQLHGEHKRLEAISVNSLSRANRLKAIHEIIEKIGDKIGIIMIDGVVDLAEDYNSLSEAQRVVSQILYWRDAIQAIFICIIHQISDGKMRGHLGTELANKCDFAIEASLDKEQKECSNVKCKLSRIDLTFPSYQVIQTENRCMLTDEYALINPF